MIPTKATIQVPLLQGIELSSDLKILGLNFNEKLKWDNQVHAACRKASQRIFILKKLKGLLTKQDLIKVYKVLILSILEYNAPVMVGMSAKNKECLEKVRKRCHRIICGSDCCCDDFTPIHIRRQHQALKLLDSISTNPHNLLHYLTPHRLPRSHQYALDHYRTNRRLQSFIPFCISLANRLHL